jgi:putative transposase
MGNHIHLLLEEGKEPLKMILKRIGVRNVFWYNWKYKRSGLLFQDRYKSEKVDDDSYFLTVRRYIHQNPVKAGMVKDLSAFKWSSYEEYVLNDPKITEIDFALNLFDEDRTKAIEDFKRFHEESNMDSCLDIDESVRLRDREALKIILKMCRIKSGSEI